MKARIKTSNGKALESQNAPFGIPQGIRGDWQEFDIPALDADSLAFIPLIVVDIPEDKSPKTPTYLQQLIRKA